MQSNSKVLQGPMLAAQVPAPPLAPQAAPPLAPLAPLGPAPLGPVPPAPRTAHTPVQDVSFMALHWEYWDFGLLFICHCH